MNPKKAVAELHEIMADPLSRKLVKAVIDWIEDRSPMGRLIIDLLEKAENGNFADAPKKAEPEPETIEIDIKKTAGIALRDNGIIIAADCRALTARISEAEATASPTEAVALQEARGHLLRASMAVERVQKGASWKDVADDLITKAQTEQGAGT